MGFIQTWALHGGSACVIVEAGQSCNGNQLKPSLSCGVQTCCLSCASGVIVVVSGPSTVSVMFRSVYCALGCSAALGCVDNNNVETLDQQPVHVVATFAT